MLVCLAAVVVVGVRAEDENVRLLHSNSVPPIEGPPGEAFLERFKVAFNERVEQRFLDRFHPFNVMKWSVELADRSYDDFRDRTASAARNAFTGSVVQGMREAAVDLPVMLWLNERQGWLADFLRNSVDSVEEEAVAPVDVSYRPVERSWWQRLSEGNQVRYGIRPFGTSPYTFLSVGLKDGDELLLLANVRYYYRHFADHCFEIAMSVPLAHRLSIDLGASCQFGRHDQEEKLVVKLLKEFKSGGILHVGLEAQRHPAFFAGIALPW